MRAAVDRAVPARLLADPDAVRDLRGDGAADGAMGADALALDAAARPVAGGGPALALRTLTNGRAPSAARPPAATPERRRKLRRSRPRSVSPAKSASDPRRASRSVLLMSIARSLFRIAVDAVIGLDLVAFAIARLALLVFLLAVGCRLLAERRQRARGGPGADDPEKVATRDGRSCPGPSLRRTPSACSLMPGARMLVFRSR